VFFPSIIRSQFGRLLYISILAVGVLAPDAARAIVAEPNSRLAGVIADQTTRQRTDVSTNQLAAAEVARRNGVLVEWNRRFGTPQRLRGTNLYTALSPALGKQLISGDRTWAQKAVEVMAYLQPLYGDSAFGLSFQPRKTECDDLGFWHVRLQQSLLGLPVVGAELIVHFNREGKPYQVNGEAIRHPSLNLVSGITAESAAESAIRWLSSEGGIPLRAEPQPALVVFALRSAPRLA